MGRASLRVALGLLAGGCIAIALLARREPAMAQSAPAAASAQLSAMARIGEQMFFDPSLSSSGRMSCASCHSPDHAFGPPNGLAVQLGGPDLDRAGLRAVPSLTYRLKTPNFSIGPESFSEAEAQLPGPKTAIAPEAMTPRGGFGWDGRADTLQEQTLAPLTSPFEMDNRDDQAVIEKLRRAPYAADLARLAGSQGPVDDGLLLAEAQFALARFQVEDLRFHAYSSKYDAYLQGKARLTPREARGLKLFEDPNKGGCAGCHIDRPGPDGSPPLFTDFEFAALGVPRNRAIPANADPAFYDLGLCGPLREDAMTRGADYCGQFKSPSLRNIATRSVFFHNGVYRTLRDAVAFYVLRDTSPERVYPSLGGKVERFDDLPPVYRTNAQLPDPPFNRKPGQRPALSDSEIDDVVAFLGTLSDGFRADH